MSDGELSSGDAPQAQPTGVAVPDWTARPRPGGTLVGRTCRIEPLADHHIQGLHHALDEQSPPSLWTYYPAGPFNSAADFDRWLSGVASDPATEAHVIINPAGEPVGMACFMRIDQLNGVAEVGNIVLSSALQRTTAATEAMALMMGHIFDLGYRRYEWKCDSLNLPSRRAAARLGFTYEGTFRNAIVYRGRNRDTAWFSITDSEWPAISAELERWLDPDNFSPDGQQLTALTVGTPTQQ